MNKLRIYIDMDGVLANFDKAANEHPSNGIKGYRPDLILDFSKFEIMPGAKKAVEELFEMGHDLFIATTPPWKPSIRVGTEKRLGGKTFPST